MPSDILSHFGLDTLRDLPNFEALEDAGLLSKEKLLAGEIPLGLSGGEEEAPEEEPGAVLLEGECVDTALPSGGRMRASPRKHGFGMLSQPRRSRHLPQGRSGEAYR